MRKIISFLTALILCFFTFSTSQVQAKVLFDKNNNITVSKNEIIDDDLFIGAQNAIIDGTINGDVFVGGQTVTIDGIVNGNLHVGAGSVILRGKVKGNTYIVSGNVVVNSSIIDGSLLVGAATVNVDKDTVIGGSLITGGNNITLDSQIKRSLYLCAANSTINNNTKIGKDLNYVAKKDGQGFNIAKEATILGNTYKFEPPVSQPQETRISQKQIASFKIFTTLFSFFGVLIVGVLYLKFWKHHLTESVNLISKSFWKSLGIGALITIAAVPSFFLMLITIIGIPLLWVTLLIFLLGLYLTKIIAGITIGNWVTTKFKWNKLSIYWTFILGLAIFYILKLIPIIGWLVSLVTVWLGLGALATQLFSKSK